jgi:SRSO17 transposase
LLGQGMLAGRGEVGPKAEAAGGRWKGSTEAGGVQRELEWGGGPMECSLAELSPVRIERVVDRGGWQLWKEVVGRYHYLGVKRPTGRRLHYLVWCAAGGPIGAVGWKGGSLKLGARERFIGWDTQQRQAYLDHVLNNYRFVLVDWLRVPNLASHVLGQAVRVVVRDWRDRYGVEPWVLETFVDQRRFTGASYRAAGWEAVGRSSGYGKRGQRYAYHGQSKEVYLYVAHKHFRRLIGCERRPDSEVLGAVQIWERELQMMIQNAGYDPELIDWTEIDQAMREDIAKQLVEFHALFHDCFPRPEGRLLGLTYLRGLVSDIERKNIEAIALAFAGPKKVRCLQNFLSRYPWDDEKLLERAHTLLHESIGEQEGMECVDSTEIPKKGKESVGVARQYCGALGKTDNCQSGVFVSFTSQTGYALLEGRLYLPPVWFSPEYEARRKACKIPEGIVSATKTQIALQLLCRQHARGIFRAPWVGCDSFFGVDSGFRDELARMGRIYLAAIKPKSKVWVADRSMTAMELAADPDIPWQGVVLAEGAKGPILADVARMRVRDNRDGKPGIEQWLILRRLEHGGLKYYLSNAPAEVTERTLWDALVRRWPIEQCFEDGKKHLGMDHYENRSWTGWHRHMLYVILAMLFLLRLRLRYIKNSDAHPASAPAAPRRLPGPTEAGQRECHGHSQVLHAPQRGGLPLAPQEETPAVADLVAPGSAPLIPGPPAAP